MLLKKIALLLEWPWLPLRFIGPEQPKPRRYRPLVRSTAAAYSRGAVVVRTPYVGVGGGWVASLPLTLARFVGW